MSQVMAIREIRFEVRPFYSEPRPPRELVPYLDGVSLVELVAKFERAAGFDVPGEYAGLVLEHFSFGNLTRYLTGESELSYWADQGMIALLGCTCGEVGCWPLEARVRSDDQRVTWDGFVQPHRPKRDYRDFGPFEFDRARYDAAVLAAIGC